MSERLGGPGEFATDSYGDGLAASAIIRVLGQFQVDVEGSSIPLAAWGNRDSARSLVKLLAVQWDHRLHRDEIMESLWPDADPSSAANRFHKALHAARRAFQPDLERGPESRFLHFSFDVVALNPQTAWIDIQDFRNLAQKALASRNISDLEKARRVYAGELLPEDKYEEWTQAPRESLANLYERVLLELGAQYFESGQLELAGDIWERVLNHDPTNEDAYRGLMLSSQLRGQRTKALRYYDRCRKKLWTELKLAPELETEKLRERIAAGDEAEQHENGSAVPSHDAKLVLHAKGEPRSSSANVPRSQPAQSQTLHVSWYLHAGMDWSKESEEV